MWSFTWTHCSTVFKSNEEELAIWVLHQPPPDACFVVILLLLQPNTTEHLILNPGSVHTVTVDNLPHLVPTTFGLFVKKTKKWLHFWKDSQPNFWGGLKWMQAFKSPNEHSNASCQPASQLSDLSSRHLSHLWLDPCCLNTVHAVVIGPYTNQ